MTAPHDDADLAAVREAVAARTADRELSVARSWGAVVARRAGVERPPRRNLARRLAPVAAAATVAAVALGTVTLVGPRWDGLGFLGTADPGSPGDSESYHPNLDPPSVRAVASLLKLAAAAEPGEPVTVADGQLVYVRSEGWATSYLVTEDAPAVGQVVRQDREAWYDPDGMVPVRIVAGDEVRLDAGPDLPPEARPEGEPDASRGEPGPGLDPPASPLPASPEPGPYAPTPEWLAGLPTDPQRLRAQLRTILTDDQTWSTDHAIWTAMSELYATAELLIPPEVRAALLRAFTELRGLTAVDVDIDGRRLVGIRHVERGSGDEILFDPATGRAVGRRSVSPPAGSLPVPVSPSVVPVSPSPVPASPPPAPANPSPVPASPSPASSSPAPASPHAAGADAQPRHALPVPPSGSPADLTALEHGISYQSLWTQTVVDEVGETG